jgi:mRNA interferase YafQ
MSLKKNPASKRASLPRASDYTKTFISDWTRLSKTGRYDMNRLKEVMLLLIANEAPLEPEWKDHALTGNWSGYRECHVGGDFLLIYQLDETPKFETVVFVRTGTHSELFE